jgi:transcriptional regulator with XRE-family HTH domain
MELKKLKQKLLADKKFRDEYYKKDLAVAVGEMVIDARVRFGLTQAELAEWVGTKQPSIARLENGNRIPDMAFLERIAKALGARLIPPKFVFTESNEIDVRSGVRVRKISVRRREGKTVKNVREKISA